MVGDRSWRVIVTTDPEETVATVWVIGDRQDAACYEEAQERIARLSKGKPEAETLASAMFQLSEMQRAARKARRRRK